MKAAARSRLRIPRRAATSSIVAPFASSLAPRHAGIEFGRTPRGSRALEVAWSLLRPSWRLPRSSDVAVTKVRAGRGLPILTHGAAPTRLTPLPSPPVALIWRRVAGGTDGLGASIL